MAPEKAIVISWFLANYVIFKNIKKKNIFWCISLLKFANINSNWIQRNINKVPYVSIAKQINQVDFQQRILFAGPTSHSGWIFWVNSIKCNFSEKSDRQGVFLKKNCGGEKGHAARIELTNYCYKSTVNVCIDHKLLWMGFSFR